MKTNTDVVLRVNVTVRGSVRDALNLAAYRGAEFGAGEVYRAVFWAVGGALTQSVDRVMRHDPLHPSMADFLAAGAGAP